MKILYVSAFFIILFSQEAYAECAGLSEKPTVREMVSCVNELANSVTSLKKELEVVRMGALPAGAVVAFDLSRGCPVGWELFLRGVSRTIVGAGSPQSGSSGTLSGQTLSNRSFGERGGEEQVRLTVEEMPKHDHGAVFGGDGKKAGMLNEWAYHAAGYAQIRAEGGSQPHNNMPPYIALFYCKKM